jgi:Cu/Ag efflux protein CusF
MGEMGEGGVRLGLALTAALAMFALAADADVVEEETGASGIFFGRGVVKAVAPSTGALTLDHGAIKGCMPAMAMMYRVKSPDLSKDLQPGDEVNFTIDGAKYLIVDVKRVARGRSRGQS